MLINYHPSQDAGNSSYQLLYHLQIYYSYRILHNGFSRYTFSCDTNHKNDRK